MTDSKRVMKVMLMYPNLRWLECMERTLWILHPYNVGLLAAMLEDKYEVKFVDCTVDNLSQEEFSKIIETEKPDILGISVLTSEYGKAGALAAKIAKDVDKNIKTVFGGVHATSIPAFVIDNPSVDYVVVGEGEYVFRKLCDYLAGEGNMPDAGIVYKKDGKVINAGRAPFIEDLDKLPYPAYHLVNFEKYSNRIMREDVGMPRAMPYASTITSRGCPYGCTFCEVETIFGKKPRLRSVENILGEIEYLIRNYGIKCIIFQDDNLIMNKERAKNLFRAMIEKKYNLKWNMPAISLFNLDEELIDLMKESGCQYVSAAAESGCQRVLDELIKKPLKVEHSRKMIQKLKDVGIDLSVNFCIGFPGETWDEIRQTLKFADDIDVDYVKIFIATPLPNTELYRIAKEKGFLVENFHFDQHLWTDGWIKTPDFRPQDLRILRAFEWDRINFSNPEKKKKILKMMDISEERLDEIRKETLKIANP